MAEAPEVSDEAREGKQARGGGGGIAMDEDVERLGLAECEPYSGAGAKSHGRGQARQLPDVVHAPLDGCGLVLAELSSQELARAAHEDLPILEKGKAQRKRGRDLVTGQGGDLLQDKDGVVHLSGLGQAHSQRQNDRNCDPKAPAEW
jgi:hypothetical protein